MPVSALRAQPKPHLSLFSSLGLVISERTKARWPQDLPPATFFNLVSEDTTLRTCVQQPRAARVPGVCSAFLLLGLCGSSMSPHSRWPKSCHLSGPTWKFASSPSCCLWNQLYFPHKPSGRSSFCTSSVPAVLGTAPPTGRPSQMGHTLGGQGWPASAGNETPGQGNKESLNLTPSSLHPLLRISLRDVGEALRNSLDGMEALLRPQCGEAHTHMSQLASGTQRLSY